MLPPRSYARVVELVDTQDSGSCARKGVRVQLPLRALPTGSVECHHNKSAVSSSAPSTYCRFGTQIASFIIQDSIDHAAA